VRTIRASMTHAAFIDPVQTAECDNRPGMQRQSRADLAFGPDEASTSNDLQLTVSPRLRPRRPQRRAASKAAVNRRGKPPACSPPNEPTAIRRPKTKKNLTPPMAEGCPGDSPTCHSLFQNETKTIPVRCPCPDPRSSASLVRTETREAWISPAKLPRRWFRYRPLAKASTGPA